MKNVEFGLRRRTSMPAFLVAVLATAMLVTALGLAVGAPSSVGAVTNCNADPTLDTEELTLVQLINNFRAQYGRAALIASNTLSTSAQWKATDMAANGYLADNDPNPPRSWSRRLYDCGYTYATNMGESIAGGPSLQTAQAAFDHWMQDGLAQTDMTYFYSVIGVGRASGPTGWYWTVDYGSYNDTLSTTPPAATSTSAPSTSTSTTVPTATRTSTTTPTQIPTATATPVPFTATPTQVLPTVTPTRTSTATIVPTRTSTPIAPTSTFTATSTATPSTCPRGWQRRSLC